MVGRAVDPAATGPEAPGLPFRGRADARRACGAPRPSRRRSAGGVRRSGGCSWESRRGPAGRLPRAGADGWWSGAWAWPCGG
eukprot:2317803-Lingulodinium_polyedra.AAC.1